MSVEPALSDVALSAVAEAVLGLDRQASDALQRVAGWRVLRPGSVLYEQGEDLPSPALHVVVRGLLVVQQRSTRGDTRVLAVLGPGDLAGEVGVLDPQPRSTTISALLPSHVAVVGRDDVLAWMAQYPQAAEVLLRVTAGRLRKAEGDLVDLPALDGAGRLVRVLLGLADRWGHPADGGVALEHALTQVQLAALAGCTRETANKLLKELSGRGWLVRRHGQIQLVDLVALRALTRLSPTTARGRPGRRGRRRTATANLPRPAGGPRRGPGAEGLASPLGHG